MLDFDILDTVAGRQVKEEGREEGLEEGREEGREEGLEEGREEGLEEGREEGLEEGKNNMKEMLLMNTKVRFGNISSEIKNKIKELNDIKQIRELFTQSFSCDNEEEFCQLL